MSAAGKKALLDAIAGGLAFATLRLKGLRADRGRGSVHLPGSILPLVRNLAIFAAKYTVAVLIARRPDWQSQLLWWDVGISAVAAGYFFGWLARFFLTYRSAPDVAQEVPAERTASS